MTVQIARDPGVLFLSFMASFGVFITHALLTDKKNSPGSKKEQVCLFPEGFLMNKWETRYH